MEQKITKASRWPRRRVRAAWPVVAAVLAFAPAGLRAQCVGDCDSDQTVQLNEIILGVGIALDSRDVADCAAFDADGSLSVEITELIDGVGNSLEECLVEGTATPTATATPSATPSPTVSELCGNGQEDEGEECDDGRQCEDGTTDCTDDPAVCKGIVNGECAARRGDGCQDNCRLSRCGDGITDNLISEDPETCDDGNTEEGFGDVCPANCRVAACAPTTTLRANVDFATQEAGTFIVGMEIFLRYPEGLVSIPGSSGDPVVRQAVQSTSFSVTPNDVNFALTTVLSGGATAGNAFTVDFQRCESAALPDPSQFTCVVGVATDDLLNDVTDQVSCSVVVP